MLRRIVTLSLLVSVVVPFPAVACDYCSIYTATKLHESEAGAFSLFLANQYTSYEKTDRARSLEGVTGLPLREAEFLEEYTTTVVTGQHDFSERFGLLVSLPFLYRAGEERVRFQETSFDDSGLGDMAVQLRFAPYIDRDQDSTLYFGLTAGVELPTGDSDGLREQDGGVPRAESATPEFFPRHHTAGVGGVQGRSFALGSGSTDVLLGSTLYYRKLRWFLLGVVNYGLRTEGKADFEFGDDLIWNVGPAYYFFLDHNFSLALRVPLSGEYKEKDTQRGRSINGSELNNLYLGPELLVTVNDKWTGELAVDLPVYSDASDSFSEPDFRLRFALGRRF